MSRRNPPAKWTLPVTIHPARSLCVVVPVPDETFYRAAFWGAMLDLASAYKWQDDIYHTAREVAIVWRAIVDNLAYSDCNPVCPPTIIQESEYEMAICEQLRFENGKLQGLCCGEWTDIPGQDNLVSGGGSQPGPAGEVAAGECLTFNMVVPGNERLLIPVGVDDGYVITISAAAGGWWDGNVLHAWQCPSGQTYAFGACVAAGPTDPTSPAPTLPTGRLIAILGSATLDAYNTTIAVPAGTGPVDMYLQMNDATLSNNQGSISCTVKICKDAVVASSHGISYNFGSGPASVVDGQIFSVASAPRSEPYGVTDNIEIVVSPCVKLEVLSQTGWISADAGGLNWNVLDCASVGHPVFSPSGSPAAAFGNQEVSVAGINSKGPFTLTFRATAV